MENTKLVRINLAAMTRVEYSEVIEVPADMSASELDRLLEQRYAAVDGGKYQPDPEYWERSKSCAHEPVNADEVDETSLRLTRRGEDFALAPVQS